MSSTSHEVAPAEIAPSNRNLLTDFKRWALAGTLGAVAALGASGSVQAEHGNHGRINSHLSHKLTKPGADTWYAPPMEMGVSDTTALWAADSDTRIPAMVAEAKNVLHEQAFKIFLPVILGIQQDQMNQILEKACVTAKSVAQNGMDFYVDFVPQTSGGQVDGIPDSQDRINQYDIIVDQDIDEIAECAPGRPLNAEVANEVNYAQDNTLATAQHYEALLEKAYPAFHIEALKDGIPISIIGFELSSSQDPIGFLYAFESAEYPNLPAHIKKLVDKLGFHPYANGQVNYLNFMSKFMPAVRAAAGNAPVVDTEFASGALTNIAKANAYVKAIQNAACQGSSSFISFQVVNDAGWGSAPNLSQDLNNPSNFVPNPVILPVLQAAILKAEQGKILCMTLPKDPPENVPANIPIVKR